MYASYTFYAETYLGRLAHEEYNSLVGRASAVIDRLTFGRAESATGAALTAVKMAECAVVDELHTIAEGGDIASESNDGVSRSYASGGVPRSKEQRIAEAARLWLDGANLTFAGV